MKDICIDYCESTNCCGCTYENATKKQKEDAYTELMAEQAKRLNEWRKKIKC